MTEQLQMLGMGARPRPFLKWAGGKQQLVKHLFGKAPHRFNRYFEPFLGGGALFFGLSPSAAVLSDVNEELIATYLVVRDKVDELIVSLHKHRNDQEYYSNMRSLDLVGLSDVDRASRFIYLNRTCFNGLYRVNRQGQFNTPFGRYKHPVICNASLLQRASEALRDATIVSGPYEDSTKSAGDGDFVYLDPPYVAVSRYSDFKRYHSDPFGWTAHLRLAEFVQELSDRGCFVMLSNSYTAEVVDLYKKWKIEILRAKRLINSDPEGRAAINEILVTNY